jgi:F0F1-type ATP synthase membrane subunit b/b'
MTLGALGVSFLVLMSIVIYAMKKIVPAFNQMNKSNLEIASILTNNTQALETVALSVKEVAKSNENVAHMVQLLTNTLESQADRIERHDKDAAQRFTDAISQLRMSHEDISKAVEKNGENNDRQHKEISEQLFRHDDRGQRIETEIGRVKGHVEQVKLIISRGGEKS